jgi:HD-GYP domain-containing protein (c-di-GMP phosphodiesterase class II)/DNA-binding CsgD family transcriptional regulator
MTLAATSPDTPLGELISALSLACDLGNNFPLEKGLRNTVLATRLAKAIGLSGEQLSHVYYVSLLRFIGCAAFAVETARRFGDDNALRGAMAPVDFARPREVLRQAASLGKGPLGRLRSVARFLEAGRSFGEGLVRSDCEVMARAAARLGLAPPVAKGLSDAYERWDGKGGPRGVSGEAIQVTARLVHVAHEVELHHRIGGVDAALGMIRRGSGTWFDPSIVAVFEARAADLLPLLDLESVWDLALAEEPEPRLCCQPAQLDELARTFADIVDLKSAYTLGHSSAVAAIARRAGEALALAESDLRDLALAGLLHDLGRLSVPTGIWDKKGPLNTGEWERVRLHAYYTERVLIQSPLFANVARIAALHHERLDGRGYHRAAPAATQPATARVLAAADVYQALTEDRPHRAAYTPERAVAELMRMVEAGTLDAEAARAVSRVTGHKVKRGTGSPVGLTVREVQVLRHLARGLSEKEIGKRLFIAPGTVHSHVVHIYEKTGLSTRAGVALFAMEHGLLQG